jgi:diguanylate cyclase (GGDEF)-like protein
LRLFRLQFVQWWAGLAIVACCLLLGGMSFVTNADAYRRASAAVDEFRRFRVVLDALNAISAERGPANILMSAQRGDPGPSEHLATARRETDVRLGLAERLMGQDAGDDEMLSALSEVWARLRHARGLVDAVASMTEADRNTDSVTSAIEAMFAAVDAAEHVRDPIGQEVVRVAPEVANEVFFSVAASALRDYSGRLGSYVVMRLKSGLGDDPENERHIALTLGRLSFVRASLTNLAGAMEPNARRAAALDAVERRFFESALPRAVAAARAAGSPEAMTVTEFTRTFVRDLLPAQDLRVMTADLSETKLEAMKRGALQKLSVSASLMLAVCLVMMLLGLVFRRLLFRPLTEARGQMMAIARGDLSEPDAAPEASPEVGDMLAGLNAIRDEQRWRRELEQRQTEMARQLKRLSETDGLTGILNRRAIQELALRHLGEADWLGEGVGLILFDVDRFKQINDRHGHEAGDEVLRTIAREVPTLLGPHDAFARFGGEEFVILLPGMSQGEPELLATKLCERLPAWTIVEGRPVTASFGVAIRDAGSGLRWEELVAVADRRLYAAKRGGRARVVASDEAQDEAAA